MPCNCAEVLHSRNLPTHSPQWHRKGTGAEDRGTFFFSAQLLSGSVGTRWLPLIPGLCCNPKSSFLSCWCLQIRLSLHAAAQQAWEEFPPGSKAGIGVRNKKSCEVRDSGVAVKTSFQQGISEGKAQGGRWRGSSSLSEVVFSFPSPRLVKANRR